MRIILIVQFIIIALGAYYVYTLTAAPGDDSKIGAPVSVESKEETAQAKINQTASTTIETEATTPVPVSVGTDVGMEYPDIGSETIAQ